MNKRNFPFYSTPQTHGRDGWCRAAWSYYHDYRGQGAAHDRAVELAVREADADLLPTSEDQS